VFGARFRSCTHKYLRSAFERKTDLANSPVLKSEWKGRGLGSYPRLFLLYKIEVRLTWNTYAHRYTYPAEGELLCPGFCVRQQ
jgi:hypothetical protein